MDQQQPKQSSTNSQIGKAENQEISDELREELASLTPDEIVSRVRKLDQYTQKLDQRLLKRRVDLMRERDIPAKEKELMRKGMEALNLAKEKRFEV